MTTDPLHGLTTLRGPRRPPVPDGVDLALAAGRRRLRHRRISTTAAGVSAATALGASLVAGAHPGTTGLAPAGSPPRHGTTGTPRAAAPASPLTPPLPSAVSSPAPSGSPVPHPTTVAGSALPTRSPSPAPTSPAPPRWVGTAPTGPDGLPAVRVGTFNDPTYCATNLAGEVAGQHGFCNNVEASTRDVTIGEVTEITYTLCREATEPKTLSYRTAYEIDLGIYSDFFHEQPPEFVWGDPAAFPPDPHTITFAHGDCRTWTVEWMGQDTAGYALPDGSYDVLVRSAAFEWFDEDGAEWGPSPTNVDIAVHD